MIRGDRFYLCKMRHNEDARSGFTLIELSIVLVIIGLIVGGVLVGQDLIRAAEVRATISQLEKYNAAANTFYGKYGYLPGDINPLAAQQFGFSARTGTKGRGNGDGLIEGIDASARNDGSAIAAGETALFWVDLSTAHLIDGGFSAAGLSVPGYSLTATMIGQYMPEAKLGRSNYIYVWSGGLLADGSGGSDGKNYFGISGVYSIPQNMTGYPNTMAIMTVRQAYDIDTKIDDGLPQSGRVMAYFNMVGVGWAAGGTNPVARTYVYGAHSGSNGPTTNSTAASASTCYDNGASAGVAQHYSIGTNGGAGSNCGLTISFQ